MRARRVRDSGSNIFILRQTGVMKIVLKTLYQQTTLYQQHFILSKIRIFTITPRSHNHTDAAKTQIIINLIVLQARDNFTTLSYYAETDDY